jgi:hypothetical protein
MDGYRRTWFAEHRGAGLPGPRRSRLARTARLIAATMPRSGGVALTGAVVGAAAIVWAVPVVGRLAWLSIPSGTWPRAAR